MPAIAIAFVSAVTRIASRAASLPSAEISSPGGTRRKTATTGSSRKSEDGARREDERRPNEAVYDVGLGSGRNP